jgi:hypothetical protein
LRFNQIIDLGSLNENVQGAKAYIKKLYAEKYKITVNDMSPDDVRKALGDQRFKAIIELTEKNPGYALPFLKFTMEQRVSPYRGSYADEEISNLPMLMNWIQKNPLLVSRLPRKIEEYSNSMKIDGVSGFEKLADDIRTLERELSVRWLVDTLPIKPRNEYKNLTAEKKKELVNIGVKLNELDKDDLERTITKRLTSKIKAMSNYSIWDIVDYMNNYVKGYTTSDLQNKLEQIRDLSPGAGILYNDYPYLALSMRTEQAQRKLCSVANWCINRGQFKEYASDSLQINIFNYSLPSSDSMFLTGTTIKYSGKVSTSHDINDLYIKKSDSPKEQFISMGYPLNFVNSIIKEFPTEISIRKLLDQLDKIHGPKKNNSDSKFISHILGIADQSLQGRTGDSEWANIVSIVVQILDQSSEFFEANLLEFLEEYGVYTQSGLKVLEDIIAPRISKEQINSIYNASIETFDEINRLYLYKMGRDNSDPSLIERLKKVLDGRDKILSSIKKIN